MSEKLQKLEEILKIVNRDVPSTKEVADLILRIVTAVKEAKKFLETQAIEHKEELENTINHSLEGIINGVESFEKEINSTLKKDRTKTDNDIARLENDLKKSLESLKSLIPENVDLTDIESRLHGLETKEVSPEATRDALELLKEDERLDKSAIKGLDVEISRLDKKIDDKPTGSGGGGARKIEQLLDVHLDGLANGETLSWNDTNKRWENTTSGGGTDVTLAGEDYLSLSGQQITANPIDLDNLSATGTPSSSTFLRGDNTWATPAGSGDVSKVGTPVNNQVGVWTGDGTLEGDADLTFDTSTNTLATGIVTVSDDAYGAGWNGSNAVPTKNAVYDKIETISAGSGISEELAIVYAVSL